MRSLVALLVFSFVIALVQAQGTIPMPDTCQYEFRDETTDAIVGCQQCQRPIGFYLFDGEHYVSRANPDTILSEPPSLQWQNVEAYEALGFGQCTYVGEQATNTWTAPTLNCPSSLPNCYYTMGILKAASYGFDYGYGPGSCPWFNVAPGTSLKSTEWCNTTVSKNAISHLVWCVDAPKPCHIETCLCAEWQLRNFTLAPTGYPCGARVTWRVWNYCANSPIWLAFKIADLGEVKDITYSSLAGYRFEARYNHPEVTGFQGAPTVSFWQQEPLNTAFGFNKATSYEQLKNYVDISFTVTSWPGAQHDWYMGAHMGPYWDYYDTTSTYYDGDWSQCQKSREGGCGADDCATYCCYKSPTNGEYSQRILKPEEGTCAFNKLLDVLVPPTNGGCTLDCNCQPIASTCPVTTTTTEATTTTDSSGSSTTTDSSSSTTTDSSSSTTTTTDSSSSTTTTSSSTTTTGPGKTTSPPTTNPPLPCELEGKCVTLPPVTQNPNVPTRTPCPGDCNGNGDCGVDGKCVCDENLPSKVEGATVSYEGDDCSVAVINLPKAVCEAFTTCERCSTAQLEDGKNCTWHTCSGAGVCLDAGGTYGGCSATTACAGTIVFEPGTCPDNCSNAGNCDNGTCICKSGVSGINCGSRKGLSAAAKAAAISGGVIAAIVICGVVVIVLISFGAKKAVDWVALNEQASAKSHVSPLYNEAGTAGASGIFIEPK